jgi:hypothetical protein
MRLSFEQLQSLARFSRGPDWAFLSQVIDALEAEVLVELRQATGERVYRAQGAAKMLADFRGHVAGAAKTLERNSVLQQPTVFRM